MLIRLKAADTVINPKVTVVGFDHELEIADAATARKVQDAFDLHKHGIEAAKDAHEKLLKDHKDLQGAFDEYKAGMEAVGDDEDGDVDEMDDEEKSSLASEEEAEENPKKKAGDSKRRVGYAKDGKPTLRYRLARALDRAAKWKAKATDTSAHEKLAEERANVIDAAAVFLGDKFDAKGKSVHDIRLAAIDAAGKSDELKDIVAAQLDGVKVDKLTAKDAARVFKTIVAIGGRTSGGGTRGADDGGDAGISRALLGGAGGSSSAAPKNSVFGRDMYLHRVTEESRVVGRPVNEDRN